MNILEILEKKERKEILSKEELEYVINGFLDGTIKDYQMSAFLTEIDLLGLTEEETIDLTNIMLNSGDKIKLDIEPLADKHSTGGVGDKTTLIVAPLVASLGVNVAKMSGRGLGHTGGTIDKLESIKGFRTEMTLEEFENQVKRINIALVGQMGNLVPADKKIYALRDVSGTVDSIPLIASSVMSKKLASGANTIVLDLKVGGGALVESLEEAKELGTLMVKIGNMNGKNTACLLTNMDQPLGFAVGNALEVLESIETLKGNGPEDLNELVIRLSSLMISLSKNIPLEEATKQVEENLYNGKGYEKFKEWVEAQNGDINSIEVSQKTKEIVSEKDGYIKRIDALKIGKLARELGAGRLTKEDIINFKVGIVLNKKVGDKVEKGEKLLTIYYEDKEIKEEDILAAYEIVEEKVEKPKVIIDMIK
ncbi:MAG: thymidine phosphorylase [Bacilli bacterium]|nr:thymidine phosphorylase [Bacilli bacterium]